MRYRKTSISLSVGGFLLLLGLLLLTAQIVSAQCGSQASSCKNCHEVQGQDPVNNDGTDWHESHAFGDFCYICHAGNQQATDKDAAHQGMEPPLDNIKASCASCHPNDLEARAAVYAKELNVEIGGKTEATATVAPTQAQAESTEPAAAAIVVPATPAPTVNAPADNELVVNDPNVVDYVERYNQIVLGEQPVNWGNIVLIGLIALVVVVGGAFVLINEIRLSRTVMRPVEGEYPEDVVELLPALARLKADTRHALRRILSNPKKTDKVIDLIDTVVTDNEESET